jgi:hypothetical protein
VLNHGYMEPLQFCFIANTELHQHPSPSLPPQAN